MKNSTMTKMLTAKDVMNFQNTLSAASYKSIDQFLCTIWGIDYQEMDYYLELKEAIEATMELEIIDHPNGYKIYQWNDK